MRAPDRREAVRDDQRRAAVQKPVERLLDQRSECVSSELVASSRIRMRGSRKTARAIAMRWRWPPERRMPRSPTRWHTRPESSARTLRRWRRGRQRDLGVGRVDVAVANVVGDRPAEELQALAKRSRSRRAGPRAEPLRCRCRRSGLALLRLEKTRHEVHDRRLARARGSDQRHDFAALRSRIDVAEARADSGW